MSSIAYLQSVLPSLVDGPWWFTALVKITLLLACAWLVHFAIAKLNPRWRVLLWRSAVVGICAVALLDVSRFISLPLRIEAQNIVSTVSLREDGNRKILLEGANDDSSADRAVGTFSTGNTARPSQNFESGAPLLRVIPDSAPSDSPAPALSQMIWPLIAGSVWLMGVLFSIVRMIVGRRRLTQIVNDSQAHSMLSQHAAEIAKDMHVVQPAVFVSDQISSPFVCRSSHGITLLLPSLIVDSSDYYETAAILTHELSHVASGDLQWNLLIKIVATLLWPHPLMWRLRQAHVVACEFVSDADSARRMKDPALYVKTLAKVALNASAANQSHLPGLTMARVSDIRRRLERVVETVSQLPLSRRRIAAALSIGLVGCVALGAFQMVYADPVDTTNTASADSAERTIEVHIVDEQNNAISDPQFEAEVYAKPLAESKKVTPKIVSDGVYRFTIEDDAVGVSLFATSKGRVRLKAHWFANGEPLELPEEFFFRLSKGTKASGRIVDQQQNPIEDAKVHLLVRTNQHKKPHNFYYDYFVTTDEEGNWISDQIPADAQEIWVRLEHPDFLSDNTYGATVQNVSVETLRAGTHVAEMKQGVVLKGTVLDESGRPIQGASVHQGSDRFGSNYPSVKTNSAGEFQFDNSKPGQTILTVIAKGFAPELKAIDVTEDPDAVAFELKPGNTIKVKLVDTAGKPIKGGIFADTWRGHRSLKSVHHNETDAKGNWTWKDAPEDAVEYSILSLGFMSKRGHKLTPSSEVQTIVLDRQLEVLGSVTDAKTGEPIKNFSIVPGIGRKSSPITWVDRNAREGSQGNFKYIFEYPYDHHFLKIRALGYSPATSRKLLSNEGKISIDFELTPGDSMTGTILTPDGKPAVGATVTVAVPNQMNEIVEGHLRGSSNRKATSDEQGKFSMPQEESESYKLFFSHESGAAILADPQFQSGQEIKLEPWARITGVVKFNGKVSKRAKVGLIDLEGIGFPQAGFTIRGETQTDDQGRFAFNKIVPNWSVMTALAVESGSGAGYRKSYTHGVRIETESGKAHDVVIGGDGRTIVGRIEVPDTAPEFDWGFCQVKPHNTMPKKPDGFEGWPPAKRQQWYLEAMETSRNRSEKNYTFAVKDDGSFRVEGLPPGEYELKVTLWNKRKPRERVATVAIGTVSHRFTVKKPTEIAQPIDLGPIPIKIQN